MEKIVEQLLRSFEHIAREVQIYLLSGCVVLLDMAFLDWRYNHLAILDRIGRGFLACFAIGVVAYLVGNICLGFYYFARNIFNALFEKEVRLNEEERLAMEIKTFRADQTSYTYFVERYSLLHNMRGAMSIAFLVATIFHAALWIHLQRTFLSFIGISTNLGLIISISLFILARGTEKRMNERIVGLNKLS